MNKTILAVIVLLLLAGTAYLFTSLNQDNESIIRERLAILVSAAEKTATETPIQALAKMNKAKKEFLHPESTFNLGPPFAPGANGEQLTKQLAMFRSQVNRLTFKSQGIRYQDNPDGTATLFCTIEAKFDGAASGREFREFELLWVRDGNWKIKEGTVIQPQR